MEPERLMAAELAKVDFRKFRREAVGWVVEFFMVRFSCRNVGFDNWNEQLVELEFWQGGQRHEHF